MSFDSLVAVTSKLVINQSDSPILNFRNELNDVIDDAKRLKAELEQIRQNLVDCDAPDGLLAQVDSSLTRAGHIGKYLESKGVFHD